MVAESTGLFKPKNVSLIKRIDLDLFRSADSEFEMRISTVFGKDSIEHINIPMIIASVRSESLSQGGKFVLDWTGISGPRLEYRQSFDAYHNKILHGLDDGYMPFPLNHK